MMRSSYRGLFEDWEVGVAKKVIDGQRKSWRCLDLQDFDDLLQECLAHWYSVRDGYNPSAGASKQTYMSRVVRHKIGHILEKLTSDKRKMATEAVSLDQPISDEEDAPTLLDTLSGDERLSTNLRIHTELKIDITRTVRGLTPKQQELCRLLSEEGLTVQEASQILNTHRSTVYDEIKRIKAVFEQENLHEYL